MSHLPGRFRPLFRWTVAQLYVSFHPRNICVYVIADTTSASDRDRQLPGRPRLPPPPKLPRAGRPDAGGPCVLRVCRAPRPLHLPPLRYIQGLKRKNASELLPRGAGFVAVLSLLFVLASATVSN